MYYDVKNAACLREYKIYIEFEDGTKGILDLNRIGGRGEVFAPLAEKQYFCKMRVDPQLDTIVWPNGADLSPEVLYDKVKQAQSGVAVY
jgi:hypothetical protein